ncbi:hypothetical protein [uncultured Neptuniibacter sp.]|uniref:hypothetical protein n=1 Tax=uncultured Neptuniibacter sp. TaxID=502143 RepID=UPI002615B0F0|nr:hypothetical protein [uncultured Neptuniibacter sp.]
MKLVKDLNENGIVFYWIDDSGEQISPDLYCLIVAEEWWKTYLFSQYEGAERRKSIIDRRHDLEKRKMMERNHKFSRQNPQGRRKTDQPIKVDIDLVKEKLEEFL